MYLTPAPETAVYCIPATVQRKGPRFPGNVCPERKMRTKEKEAEEEVEEEEGSHPSREPGRRRSSYRKLDRREKTAIWVLQMLRAGVPGWLLSLRPLIQSTITHHGGSCGCTRRTKPVYLLWFVFTCLKTPGK